MSTTTSSLDSAAASLGALFVDRVHESPDREAFRYREGVEWVSVTWQETAERVESLAAGLLALGIEPEQRVGIASGTRFEWILADLAIMCAGAATTTVYANTNATDTGYILADSQSRLVFAENEDQLAKLTARRPELPDLAKVILFDGTSDGDWVITLGDLAELGAKYLLEHPAAVRESVEAITPDRLATLIYTSGTTGRPKGVRLHHQAWVYQGAAITALGVVSEDDLHLLWLPLAHAFGKMMIAAALTCGFVNAVDGRVDKILDNAAVIRPTVMAAAPRIFEKAHARIVTTQQEQGGIRARFFERAFAVGLKVDRYRRAGRLVPLGIRLRHKLFDRLIFEKVRHAFGRRIRFFVSGGAPLNRDIAEWFHAAGLLILEGYGLTETAGAGFFNHPDNYKLGTVGLPFEGTSVRIGVDDEVKLHSPNVMAGYHNMPDATAEAFTEDGWLRTGDKGSLDADGFLTITGRIKDMFKTSGGKYIVPPAIEAKFIALCPYISQFVVFGESRNFCVALVCLDCDVIAAWAGDHGLGGANYRELVASAAVHDLIDESVRALNADLNRWETIKKWAFLDHDLSVEGGELTPSVKVKRAVVARANRELLDSLYA